MNITRAKAANTITLEVEGVVDNGNYKQLEEALNRELQGNVSMLVIDFGKLNIYLRLDCAHCITRWGKLKRRTNIWC